MFFHRRPPQLLSFAQRMENLRQRGFAVDGTVQRDGFAAIVEEAPSGQPQIARLGLLVGNEIAALVDEGYQKFFETSTGIRQPALASQLRSLHDFQADLRQALGLGSLYNESLGTVFNRHAYDRLSGRP
jgi:hypothetical protein